MDEVAEARARKRRPAGADPVHARTLESLRLARTDLERQLAATSHDRRRQHISQALAEIDRQIADVRARLVSAPPA